MGAAGRAGRSGARGRVAIVVVVATLAQLAVVAGGSAQVSAAPVPGADLVFVDPWDRIVQGPAAADWASLEREARAAVAAIYNVDDDKRLVTWGRDEIRAYMYARLLGAIEKQQAGTPLTADETLWLARLRTQVRERRIETAQIALDQYDAWQADACGYQPPAGFGFASIPLHASCTNPLYVGLPPAPPTAQQFQAYASAIQSSTYFGAADAAAAFYGAGAMLALISSVVVAGLLVAATGVLIGVVPAVGTAIAAALGSSIAAVATSASAFPASAAAAAAIAPTLGFLMAAGLIAVVVVATVVTAVALWQLIEAELVDDKLLAAYELAQQDPDLVSALDDEQGRLDLYSAFMQQTLAPATPNSAGGDFLAARALSDTPSAPTPVDPQFSVQGFGTPQTYLDSISWDGLPQRTYMADGWFATSVNGGPFEWDLTLAYRDAFHGDTSAVLQGDLFVISPKPAPGAVPQALVTAELQVQAQTPSGVVTRRVSWTGNHAPVLNPSVPPSTPQGSAITFTAGVSDQDPDDEVTVRWRVRQDGCVDSLLVFCETVLDGAAPQATFQAPGDYEAVVTATDSVGATTSRVVRFSVTNVLPVFSLRPTANVADGVVTLSGVFDDPGAEQVRVTVDWGDGTTTSRLYPCDGVTTFCGDAAARNTAFALSHTYTSVPPPGRSIVVTASDGIGTGQAAVVSLPTILGLAPTATGDLTEGGTITLVPNLLASGSTQGAAVEWLIEPPKPTSIFDLRDPANDARCRGAAWPTDCTWPTATTEQVQQMYRVEGEYLARVRYTDASDTELLGRVVFTVGNAPTAFTVEPVATADGRQVIVTGQFADPGEDQVTVTVDWGDGTVTERGYPCSVVLCLGSPAADRPTDFSFTHEYAGSFPLGGVTVSLADGADVTQAVAPVRAVPGAPYVLAVLPDETGGLAIVFEPPASDGNASIQSYRASCTSPAGVAGSGTATGSAVSVLVPGLTPGASYTCVVWASNVVGEGPASEPSSPVVLPTAPGAPDAVGAELSGVDAISVSFAAPVNDGGVAVSSYRVSCTSATGVPGSASGVASPLVVSDLTPGASYTCVVWASNAIGESPASSPSSAVLVPTVPGAPRAVAANGVGAGVLSVSFVAPVSDGGVAVSSYRVSCTSATGEAGSTSGTASPLEVSGLTWGATYTCVVWASNAIGEGDASSPSVPVPAPFPADVLSAPRSASAAVSGVRRLSVSFLPPLSNGGSRLISYRVSCASPTAGTRQVTGRSSPIVVTGLTAGASYTCRVAATTRLATSPWSDATAPVVAAAAPGAPTGVLATTAGVGRLSVSFTPPVSDGGAAITSYEVTCSSARGVTRSATGASSPIVVTSLRSGASYTCRAAAVNAAGVGQRSERSPAARVR